MNGKTTGGSLSPKYPKRNYRPPRLIAYGKIHTLVAAGSGTIREGNWTPPPQWLMYFRP